MSRYAIASDGSTTLHPNGLLRFNTNTSTGLAQNDFFLNPADHLDVTNLALYEAARPSNEIMTRHMSQLAASPLVRVRWLVGSDVYFISDAATMCSWLSGATAASDDFITTLSAGFDKFENVFSYCIEDGQLDPIKWLQGVDYGTETYNPAAVTGGSAVMEIDGVMHYDAYHSPYRLPFSAAYAVELPVSNEDSHTMVVTSMANAGSGVYGSYPHPGITMKGVIGLRAIYLLTPTVGSSATGLRFFMVPYPGFETLVQEYADRFGATMLASNNFTGYVGNWSANAAHNALVAAFGAKAPSGAGSFATWTEEMAWVGRPFGAGKAMILGKTTDLSAAVGGVNLSTVNATANIYYSMTFAQMAGANRSLAAAETDAGKTANLITAAERLETQPANVVGGVLLSSTIVIPSNELHTSKMWDDMVSAGVNVAAELVGSEPVSSVITRLNGLGPLTSLSSVAVEDYVIPEVSTILPILRNPTLYTINVTGVSPTLEYELRESNVAVVAPWFTENFAATMYSSGASLTTTDGANLATAASELNALIGGAVDVTSLEYQLAPDFFHAAGLPLYHSYMGASDFRARAHFVLKGLEQKGLTQQMRILAESLQANVDV